MTEKITRIHPERQARGRNVTLKPGQEVRAQMDHRAWTTITFTCPYCHEQISAPASMQQPAGHSGSWQYTLVAEHACKSGVLEQS